MGKQAVRFMNRLGDIAGALSRESGCIPKGAFVRWAMQQLWVTVLRGLLRGLWSEWM